jgi:hypothetical protein
MSSSVHFLAYASSATRPFSPEELLDLLAVSRANNLRDDLTGMLLYRGGNFLQALEGPSDAIQATMRRIARDPRHRSITHLCDEAQVDRIFGAWTMGFTDASKLDPVQHPGLDYYLSQSDGSDPSSGNADHDVFEFFRAFRSHLT